MRRFINTHSLNLLFVFIIILFYSTSLNSFSRFKEGDTIYDFTAKDLNGNDIKFSNFLSNNKVVALCFWKIPEDSSFRNYSEEELVVLQQLYKSYQGFGLEIVGLYCPWGDDIPGTEEMRKLKDSLRKNNISFSILLDHELKIYSKFGVSTLPSIILIKNKVAKYLLAGYPPHFAGESIKQETENLLELTSDQKIKKLPSLYALDFKQGETKSNFVSDKLWGEKLILTFYGKYNGEALNNPTSFAIGKNGKIYIVNSLEGKINVYDVDGKFILSFGQEGLGGENLALPWGITIDNKGNLYVTDIAKNLITIYDSDGKFLVKFGGPGSDEGKFNMPFSISIDNKNNLFVVDSMNNRVQIINGKFQFKIGSAGSKDGEFSLPTSIAFSKNETLIYIVDTNNSRIQVFDQRGNFIKKFGKPGSQKGEFNHPEGISVDNEGRVFVSDTLNNRIQIFDAQGNFISMFGHSGTNEGEFNSPGVSFFDSKGRFYVIDRKNNRIQGFNQKYIQTYL